LQGTFLNLAIFGGTFDPIHNAHLTVAREAAYKFRLDKVLFIPAAHPPHKPEVGGDDYHHRLRMVELACEGESLFEASSLESGNAQSYSIDTIEKLRAILAPGDRLFFVIGADAFADITTWHRWKDVVAEVEFIVVTRPGHEYTAPAEACVHRLDTLALPVSSSEIRRQLADGESPDELPPKVLDYIRANRLYM
jgi:nicotinate-nucleotide adenylyltransferase